MCTFRRNLSCICKVTTATSHDADCKVPLRVFIVKVATPRNSMQMFL